MEKKPFLLFIGLLFAAAGVITYLAYENTALKENNAALEETLAQTRADFSATTDKFNSDIKNLNDILASTKDELATTTQDLATMTEARDNFERKYEREKARMDEFDAAIGKIEGKVGTLEKLSQTDPELLMKYSKVYFLNENYAPEKLVGIDKKYAYNTKEDYLFYSKTLPFLEDMLSTAASDGIDLKVISAFRSFGEQSVLKSSYKMIYGTGANKFSADQGYSEHQLGTTVDLTTPEAGGSFTGFESTSAYQWLLDNAYEYGFILSYPQNNSYYQYEPWHWRFVGRALAKYLHEEGKNFYGLDQREIDQYLITFVD